MNIKIKNKFTDGENRTEILADIKEIIINEDLLHPDAESISLCFRGRSSSGIIDISPVEFERIYDQIKSRIHLIKGLKRLSGGGAVRL